MSEDPMLDDVEYDDELFGLSHRERKAARKQARRRPKPREDAPEAAPLAEMTGLEGGFTTTYQPARFEAVWLLESLSPFYEQHLITDVLAAVKGGKEATVYRCAADPTTGEELLAAKVYRPRMFRNLRNDAAYRQGRPAITGGVKQLMDDRGVKLGRLHPGALSKKTEFGAMLQHTSWLIYEYATLQELHAAGAAVPKPFAVNENALLMSYVGDEQGAAPTLSGVRLPRAAAKALFDEVLATIELMLRHGLVHGDLSAYNILYWEGRITLIDFPQVARSRTNPQAEAIFARDVRRVCEYFAQQGVRASPDRLAADLWARHAAPDSDDAEADRSALLDPASYGASEEHS